MKNLSEKVKRIKKFNSKVVNLKNRIGRCRFDTDFDSLISEIQGLIFLTNGLGENRRHYLADVDMLLDKYNEMIEKLDAEKQWHLRGLK